MIDYVEPNVLAIEKDFINHWRVWNGEDFAHGFKEKRRAIEFAKINGSNLIAYCQFHNGSVVYTHREEIKEGRS